MDICVAATGSSVPPAFTAWGSFDPNDGPGPVPNATCTMTPASGPALPFPITFTTNGTNTWIASISGLANGVVYQQDAQYTDASGDVITATTHTNITVSTTAPPPLGPPTGIPPLSPQLPPQTMERLLEQGSPNAMLLVQAFTNPRINKVFGIVRAISTGRILSVTEGQVVQGVSAQQLFAVWTILLPKPADLATTAYEFEILLRDQLGINVVSYGPYNYPSN